MFGVLLESRSRRQRRIGGAVLSAATHVAIVGTVTAFTVHGPERPAAPQKPVTVRVAYPNEPLQTRRPATSPPDAHTSTTIIAPPRAPVIDVPTTTPVGIPPVQLSSGVSLDSLIIGAMRRDSGGTGSGPIADGSPSGMDDWRGNELSMRIVTSAKPRYPASLRDAGVSGRVLVRFMVDTLGRVDRGTVTVVESTHGLFTNSVREALSAFRFRPAEVAGRRVTAFAEMPFEFRVK